MVVIRFAAKETDFAEALAWDFVPICFIAVLVVSPVFCSDCCRPCDIDGDGDPDSTSSDPASAEVEARSTLPVVFELSRMSVTDRRLCLPARLLHQSDLAVY